MTNTTSKRILIGSAQKHVREGCEALMLQAGFDVLPSLQDAGDILRAVQSQRPALLLLDYSLGGRDGLHVSSVITDLPVIVLLPPKQMGLIDLESNSRQNRYFVGLHFSRRALLHTVLLALEIEEQIQALEQQIEVLRQQVRRLRDVNLAKNRLMDQLHLPEKEAHRLLQKNSMDQSTSLNQLVRRLLEESDDAL